MIASVAASVIAFITTNIDDLFILMLLYGQTQFPAQERKISLGHTLGIAFLTLISLLTAFGTRVLPVQSVRILGLIPIFLGIRTLIDYWRTHNDPAAEHSCCTGGPGILSTAAVTIANGADNIGVYVPLFAGFTAEQLVIAFIVFFLINVLWCRLGRKLSDLPVIRNVISRYKEPAAGIVFILIGLYVFLK